MSIFITLEGIDGSGKTTASKMLRDILSGDGYRVSLIKEPTGTLLGKFIIGEVLGASAGSGRRGAPFMKSLDKKTFAMAATFLFSADRTVHIDEISAMSGGLDIIICDRFIDSTYAYQAAGLENSKKNEELKEFILEINEFILNQKEFSIDRTYLFDLKPETALGRLKGRTNKYDGFDSLPADFFNSVRDNYLYLSQRYKNRIKTVCASGTPESTAAEIAGDIETLLNYNESGQKPKSS